MAGKDFCIRRCTPTVSLFSSSREVCCIPSDSADNRLAVTFMPRTAMAVVMKSTASSPAAPHCRIKVTGRGILRSSSHSTGLAKSMVPSASRPHSREYRRHTYPLRLYLISE